MDNHEDARVTRSRQNITEAMLSLLDNRPFDDISVSDLCRTAGVSRQTFYRSFGRKEDVLLDKLDSLIGRFYGFSKKAQSLEVLFYKLGFIFFEEQVFLKKLFGANLDFHVINRFERLLQGLRVSGAVEEDTPYREVFLAGGMYNVMRHWLLSGVKESPIELTAMLERLTTPVLIMNML